SCHICPPMKSPRCLPLGASTSRSAQTDPVSLPFRFPPAVSFPLAPRGTSGERAGERAIHLALRAAARGTSVPPLSKPAASQCAPVDSLTALPPAASFPLPREERAGREPERGAIHLALRDRLLRGN